MRSEHEPTEAASSLSSSFEKNPRDIEDYPLEILDHEDEASGSSQFVTAARGSSDSAQFSQEQRTSEPLLPTSIPHPPRALKTSRCSASGIWDWIKGPSQPRKYQITLSPLLHRWQTAPGRLIERYFPSKRGKVWLLLTSLGTWVAIFSALLHSYVADREIPGHGNPVRLSCDTRLWPNATDCGLNGDSCRPFDGTFAFRCPASCSYSMIREPYFVGPQEINYRSLVIGGLSDNNDGNDTGIYRGDSAICPAALHAGILSDQMGGCGILRRMGEQSNFPSVRKHGISSVDFSSHFPLSFTFDRDYGDLGCLDLRWPLFAFSVAVSTLLSLFTTSPAAFYSSIFFIVYFQVALSSDPPYSPDHYEVVSTALGRFLPCAFVGFALYYFCVRHTLENLDAHWDKTVLWLGSCWVGALETDTFDRIPLSRLTSHDIQQQPGAIPALIIIVGVLCFAFITQAIAFRNEGRLPKMLAIYGIMACGMTFLLIVPHMTLRIHHYILALLFLPGTTLQTRPSLVYQGLLVGLFINGIARWGFDSILQTASALLNGAQLGSALPQIAAPLALSAQNIVFSFPNISKDAGGISVIVNDVERFQAFKSENGSVDPFNWTRYNEEQPEYFRFGYIKAKTLGGIWYQDFTKPVVWAEDGRWNQSNPG